MEKLEDLLSILNENSTCDEIQTVFSKIADILLCKSHIETSFGKYRLLEIEFYFYNPNHKDTVTIPRKEDAGMWWLHEYGVDISFKSESNYYGGILIRSILDEDGNKYICGPQKCCQELFYSSALHKCFIPQIVGSDNKRIEFGATKRHIKGKDKGTDGDYRFYAKDINIDAVKNYKESPWK